MKQKSNGDRHSTVNLGKNGEQWIMKNTSREETTKVYHLSLLNIRQNVMLDQRWYLILGI